MKIKFTISISLLALVLIFGGCSSITKPILKGTYQSNFEGIGYVVQITFQPDDNSYVEYIDNREVDTGTYEKTENNGYKIESEKQSFVISLKDENSFEIITQLSHIEKVDDIK